jgi:hypothetical protein
MSKVLVAVFCVVLLITLVSANAGNVVNLASEVQDYFLSIAKGNVAGTSSINKFGANDDVSTSYEDIWDGGGTYVWPAAASLYNITSTDTDDVLGGTGAHNVSIQGLDANYNLITETINLNGQTHVPTVNQYLRVFRMKVEYSGSSNVNEGNIYLFKGTSSTGTPDDLTLVIAKIQSLQGQTLMSLYTIPAGKTGYMSNAYVTSAATKTTTFQLFARPLGKSENIKFNIDIKDADVNHKWSVPLVFTEKTDIWTQAKIDVGSTRVSSGFDIILVDN